jgi:hypothetical protein
MLEVFEQYKIKATFAVVGFLFHKNRINLYENIPALKASYLDSNLSPYTDLECIGINIIKSRHNTSQWKKNNKR